MEREFIIYWISAWVFSIVFGEIIGPFIAGNELPLLTYPLAFLVYYGILSLFFAVVVKKIRKISLAVFFVYGIGAELFLFGNIRGFTDIGGMAFFGLFYVFLFGTPLLITKKFA